MDTTIKCNTCGSNVEIAAALKKEFQASVLKEAESKHQRQVEELQKQSQLELQRIAKQNQDTIAELQRKAILEAKELIQKDLVDKESQIAKLKERAEKAEQEELKIRSEKRQLEEAKQKFEIEKTRQLDDERAKIRDAAMKEAQEQNELKFRELEKSKSDTEKALADAQRKLQQGSQQTQGEVLELELEELLKKEFPLDGISEVKKGQRGADVIQTVRDERNQKCGTIIWETKNAQWQNPWIPKLIEDQRNAGADIAVLVVSNPPEGLDTYKLDGGVFVTTRKLIVPLATTLRMALARVAREKQFSVGKNEKMEVLYAYVTSVEFKHRMETLVDVFDKLQEDLNKEKNYYTKKWAAQEKLYRKAMDSTLGMHGDMQGLIGSSIPELNGFSEEDVGDYLEDGDSNVNDDDTNEDNSSIEIVIEEINVEIESNADPKDTEASNEKMNKKKQAEDAEADWQLDLGL